MRQLEAYAEEYQERIAIQIENGLNEQIAIPKARVEANIRFIAGSTPAINNVKIKIID